MIPILFASTETNFTSNGIGSLSDAITCKVIEERNGKYVLEMTYPVDGRHYEDIVHSNYIYAIPSDGASKQPFRIYKVTKPMNGIIQVYAEHRSYQLRNIPTYSISANNASQAFTQIAAHSAESNPFTYWTDVQTSASMTITEPTSIRSVLGGIQGSVLDTYGGEYEWDNLTVKLHTHRGANRCVQLCYGKNITDISQEENIENAVTGVCPFWKSEETIVTLESNDMVVYSTNASLYPYHRTVCVDFSREFDEAPTKAQLRAKAQSYVNNLGKPHVSIKVSFAALWQTKEYEHIANLERVKLCDTVTVYFEQLGIEAQAKVVKTDYNVLLERYNSIELGDAVRSLEEQIVEMANEVKEAATSSDMMKAISHATELITGGLGGHVVMKTNANGEPEEILIMDTDDVTTAVQVLRMNLNGIGFSSNGINGPYTTAWTLDGRFVADFITTGTLRAIDIDGVNITGATITGNTISGGTIDGTDITGGTISGGTVSGETISGGTISGTTITGGSISGTTINNGSGTFEVDVDGNMTATSASIEGTITGSSISGGTISGATISTTNSGGTMSTTISGGQIECAGDQTTSIRLIGSTQGRKIYLQNANIFGYNDSGNRTVSIGVQNGGFMNLQDEFGHTTISASAIIGRLAVHDSSDVSAYLMGSTGLLYGKTLTITGTKSRASKTKNYGDRLLYCYETATPYFGDLGEGKTDESGKCYIFLDDILDESIEGKYQVFLQAYGDGRLYVSERTASYFVVEGEPNMSFGWELKAPQKGYSLHRLEMFEQQEPTEDNVLEETYQYLNQHLYDVEGEEV